MASGGVKITDFGVSSRMNPEGMITGARGTPGYIAREVVANTWFKGAPVDAYALGCTVHFSIRAKTPNEEGNTIKKWALARDFVARLTLDNPSQRMTINDALQHPFLREARDKKLTPAQVAPWPVGSVPESSSSAAARPPIGYPLAVAEATPMPSGSVAATTQQAVVSEAQQAVTGGAGGASAEAQGTVAGRVEGAAQSEAQETVAGGEGETAPTEAQEVPAGETPEQAAQAPQE
ncbi:Checkpoint kinase 2 [Mortierella sp. GBA35]|nr:Checkpoint kinase 2 [Mortierella sp. GBA35]